MKRDAFVALENHFAGQRMAPSEAFREQVQVRLNSEVGDLDITPVVSGARRFLPAAALLVLGVLSPKAGPDHVRRISEFVDEQRASSVSTELETPWEDSTTD